MKQGNAVILFGPHGSGKTTLGKIAKQLGYEVLSMSGLIKKYRPDLIELMNQGIYLEDDDIMPVFRRGLCDARSNKWLLDGIPRTKSQAFGVLNMLWDDFDLDSRVSTFSLSISDEVVIHRLQHREDGRPDDDIHSIRKRLAQYKANAESTLLHLLRYTQYYEIDSDRDEGIVGEEFSHKLNLERVRLSEFSNEPAPLVLQPQQT